MKGFVKVYKDKKFLCEGSNLIVTTGKAFFLRQIGNLKPTGNNMLTAAASSFGGQLRLDLIPEDLPIISKYIRINASIVKNGQISYVQMNATISTVVGNLTAFAIMLKKSASPTASNIIAVFKLPQPQILITPTTYQIQWRFSL